MKKLISKHYRKVFNREPKAFLSWAEQFINDERFARIIAGEVGDGDYERFLLETHLSLHKAYGPVRAWKIEREYLKLLAMMWR